jgi:beta-mannosidase
MVEAMRTHCLTDGWTFKQADDTSNDAWLPVKRVPTNVHLDLIDNHRYVITWGRMWMYLIYTQMH